MRQGYWLNPSNGKVVPVSSHDEWIRDKQNADSIGLPPYWYGEIMKIPPTDVDEIRLMAMKGGGLVCIRQYDNYVSIQFMAERHRVTGILWEVVVALKGAQIHPDERLQITNFFLKDQVDVTLAELLDSLKNERPVMREQRDEVPDISLDSPCVEKVLRSFEEYLAKKEPHE